MKDPTPARDLNTMGIVDVDLPTSDWNPNTQDDAIDEAKIYKYSNRLIDQINQTYEIQDFYMDKRKE